MANLHGFEKWNRRTAPKTDTPLVTVQQGGLFSLNQPAIDAMGNPEKVEIFFSRDRQIIAFVPAEPDSITAYPPRKQGAQKNYYIAGQKFTKYYKIDTTVARRYPVTIEDGALFLDLNSPSAIATGVRSKSEEPEAESAQEPRNLALAGVR